MFLKKEENFNTTSVFIKHFPLRVAPATMTISIQPLFSLNISTFTSTFFEIHFNTTSVFIKLTNYKPFTPQYVNFNTTSVFIKRHHRLSFCIKKRDFNTTSVFIKLLQWEWLCRSNSNFNTTSVFIKQNIKYLKGGKNKFQYNLCFH